MTLKGLEVTDVMVNVSMVTGIIGSLFARYSLVSVTPQHVPVVLQIVYVQLCAFTILLPFVSFIRVTIVIQLFVDLFLKLFVLLVLFSPF